MECKATGVIKVELPAITGSTRTGKDWEKREYVLETDEQYPKKLKFAVISYDGPVQNPPRLGDKVTVRFIVEAREHNGNWYNEVKAYRIETA